MAISRLQSFLEGAAGAYAGHLQGQAAGQEAALQRQRYEQQLAQQKQAQQIAQFQALAGLQQQAHEQAMEPYRIGQQNLALLDPKSRANVIQGGFDATTGQPPNPYDAAGLQRLIATGRMPTAPAPIAPRYQLPVQPGGGVQQAAAWGAPGGTPQQLPIQPGAAPQPTFAYDQSVAAASGIPVAPVATPPGTMTTAGTPPAPVSPATSAAPGGAPVVHAGRLGDLTLNAVSKERQANIDKDYARLETALLKLPPNDPDRLAAQNQIALRGGINRYPSTVEEASATEAQIRDALAKVGTSDTAKPGQVITSLKPAREAVVASWESLKDLSSPDDMLMVIGNVFDDTNALSVSAKGVKQPVGLPAGLAASLKDMKRVVELRDSKDPADQEKAKELAARIGKRVQLNLKPDVENRKFNSTMRAIGQLDPSRPGYEKQKADLVSRSGVAHLFPKDLGGFGNAKLDEEWQKEFAQIPHWGELPAPARAALVGRLGTLSRLLGRPFELSAADIQKSDPKTKLELERLRNDVKMQGTRSQILKTTLDLDKLRYQSDQYKLAQLKAVGGAAGKKGLLTETAALRPFTADMNAAWSVYQKYVTDKALNEPDIDNPAADNPYAQTAHALRERYLQAKQVRDQALYGLGWDIRTGTTVTRGQKMPAAPASPAAVVPAGGGAGNIPAANRGAAAQAATAPGAAQKAKPTRAQAAAYIRQHRPNVSPADLTAALDAAGY